MIIKNRVLKENTTDWISPTTVNQNTDEDFKSEWIDLTTLQDVNDTDYAFCEVKQGVPSKELEATGFVFDLPNYDIINKTLEFKLLVIDDTIGGSNIKDYIIEINGENLTPKSTFWTDQVSSYRVYSIDANNLDLDNILFKYSCIGTGSDIQRPFIYNLQARVIYSYYDFEDVKQKPLYTTSASINKYEISNDDVDLEIIRYCNNGVNGTYGALTIELNDNLRFVDNTNKKIIPAENLLPTEKYINNIKILGKKDGMGVITLSSVSLENPLYLYVLVKNNKYYNSHISILNNNNFENCKTIISPNTVGYGGGVYNNSYLNDINNSYINCLADKGNNLYNAITDIKLINEDLTFEVNKNYNLIVKTFNQNGNKLLHGTNELIIPKENINKNMSANEYGVTEFENIRFTQLGEQNVELNFLPNSNTFDYGKSSNNYKINVIKKKTKIIIDDVNIIKNNYLRVKLVDSDDVQIPNESIIFNDSIYPTDNDGYAYIMIEHPVGKYTFTFNYNGNDRYESSKLIKKINVKLENINIITDDVIARKSYEYVNSYSIRDNDGSPITNLDFKVEYFNPFLKSNISNANDTVSIEDYTESAVVSYDLNSDKNGIVNNKILYDNTTMKDILISRTTFKGNSTYDKLSTYNLICFYNDGYNETKIELDTVDVSSVVNENTIISGRLIDTFNNSGLWRNNYNNVTFNIYILCLNQSNNKIYFYKTNTEYDGKFKITIDELPVGKYTFKCIFTGTDVYDGCLISSNINVYESGNKKSIINSSDYSGNINSVQPFSVFLTDENKIPLKDKNIHFSVKDNNQIINSMIVKTDDYGYAQYDMAYNSGVYLIETTFLGDEEYAKTINKNVFVINNNTNKNDTFVKINTNINNNKNDYTINYNLSNNGQPVNDYLNVLSYNENGYINVTKISTNDKGNGSYKFVANQGVTILNSFFLGNSNCVASEYLSLIYNPITTGIITKIESLTNKIEMYENEEHRYEVVLRDNNDNILSNQIVVTEFISSDKRRKIVYGKTDDYGKISLIIDLSPDTYICNSYFIGNSTYRSCTCTSTIIVNQNKNLINTVLKAEENVITKEYEDLDRDGYFDVYLSTYVDPNEQITGEGLLINKPISFSLYKENELISVDTVYTIKETDSKGNNIAVAKYPITEYVGEYDIKFIFYGDEEYAQSSGEGHIRINVDADYKESVIEAYNSTFNYNDNKGFWIRLMDIDENPISNTNINVKITNNETNEIKFNDSIFIEDNDKGRTKIEINGDTIGETTFDAFEVGTYTVDIYYNGSNKFKPCSKTVILNILQNENLDDLIIIPDKNIYETQYGNNNIINCKFKHFIDNEYVNINSNTDLLNNYVIFDFYNRQNKKYRFIKRIELNNDEFSVDFDLSILEGGIYDCYIKYPVQRSFNEYEIQVLVNIKPKNVNILLYPENRNHESNTFNYNSNEVITAKLKDIDGTNVIKNQYLIFNIDGKNYTAITNSDGVAELPIIDLGLKVGSYDINVWNIENNNYYSNKITGKVVIEKSTFKVDCIKNNNYNYGDEYNLQANIKYYMLNRGGLTSIPVIIENVLVEISIMIDGIEYKESQITDNLGNVYFKNLPLTEIENYQVIMTVSSENLDTEIIEDIFINIQKNKTKFNLFYDDLLWNVNSTLICNSIGLPDKEVNMKIIGDNNESRQ